MVRGYDRTMTHYHFFFFFEPHFLLLAQVSYLRFLFPSSVCICGVPVQWLVTGTAQSLSSGSLAYYSPALTYGGQEEGAECKDGLEEERKKEKNGYEMRQSWSHHHWPLHTEVLSKFLVSEPS